MALWGLKMIETLGVLQNISSGAGGAYLFEVCLFTWGIYVKNNTCFFLLPNLFLTCKSIQPTAHLLCFFLTVFFGRIWHKMS